MAKIDRSENLFAEMKKVLADMADEDSSEGQDAQQGPADGRVAPGTGPADGEDLPTSPADASRKGSVPMGPALFLALAEIEPDPEQPRKFFRVSGDQVATDNDLDLLKESILQHGVLQPIAVRRLDDGLYRIIAGERRWRASVAARDSGRACRRKGYDLSRIPAVILEPETDADRLEMQLVENLARADMTPVETAKAVTRLMDCLDADAKPSMAELGRRLGRSKAWVHQMLSLGSSEAQAVADHLGVPLDAIGQTDISRMKGWMRDEDKRTVLEAIKASVQMGETLSRTLVDKAEEEYQKRKNGIIQEKTMQQQEQPIRGLSPARDAPGRAFDENGEEVDVSTVDLGSVDDDEHIDDDGMVDENGVFIGEDDDAQGGNSHAEPMADESPVDAAEILSDMPDQVAVTLPRRLVERFFEKAGRALPGTLGTQEIIEVMEQVFLG